MLHLAVERLALTLIYILDCLRCCQREAVAGETWRDEYVTREPGTPKTKALEDLKKSGTTPSCGKGDALLIFTTNVRAA
jgi:hypothetical protein